MPCRSDGIGLVGNAEFEMGEKERDYFTQLSILRFGTLLNSFSLFVTKMQAMERTCAAISISREPMGVPCFSNKARSLPEGFFTFDFEITEKEA